MRDEKCKGRDRHPLTYQKPRLLVCLRELLERRELADGMWQDGGGSCGWAVAERGSGHGALGGTGSGAVCAGDGCAGDGWRVARKGRGGGVGVVGGRGSEWVVGRLGVEVVGVGGWGVVAVDHGSSREWPSEGRIKAGVRARENGGLYRRGLELRPQVVDENRRRRSAQGFLETECHTKIGICHVTSWFSPYPCHLPAASKYKSTAQLYRSPDSSVPPLAVTCRHYTLRTLCSI